MLKRHRENRKIVRVARMLRELDACTAPPPRLSRRLSGRAALSRAA